MASRRTVRQYRYVADRVIGGVRLQHRRLTERATNESHTADGDAAAGAATDMEFFIVAFARLGELVRKMAVTLQLGEQADGLWHDFNESAPYLRDLRDWIAHPAEITRPAQRITGDALSAWMRMADGRWQRVIEIDGDLEWCELVYQRVCSILDEAQ